MATSSSASTMANGLLLRRAQECYQSGELEECMGLLDRLLEKCGASYGLLHNRRLAEAALLRRNGECSKLMPLCTSMGSVSTAFSASNTLVCIYSHALFLTERRRFKEALVVISPLLNQLAGVVVPAVPANPGTGQSINPVLSIVTDTTQQSRQNLLQMLYLAVFLCVQLRDVGALPRLLDLIRRKTKEYSVQDGDSAAGSLGNASPLVGAVVYPVTVRLAELLALTSFDSNTDEAAQLVQRTIHGLVQAAFSPVGTSDQEVLVVSTSDSQAAVDAIVCLEIVLAKLLFLAGSLGDSARQLELAVAHITDPSSLRDMFGQLSARDRRTNVLLSSTAIFSPASSAAAARRRGAWFSHRLVPSADLLPVAVHNLGLVHAAMGKPFASLAYLQRALQSALAVRQGMRISAMMLDVAAPVAYHTALQFLQAHRNAEQAFALFKYSAAAGFHHSPLTFLRMAEACLLLFADRTGSSGSSSDAAAQPSRSSDAEIVHISGLSKRMLWLQLSARSRAPPPAAPAGMALTDARAYLQMASSLKPRSAAVKLQIMICFSLVSLRLEDYYAALRYASLCLEMVSQDGVVSRDVDAAFLSEAKVCVSLWAAECLCRLDRPKEALRFLNPKLLESVASTLLGQPVQNGSGVPPSSQQQQQQQQQQAMLSKVFSRNRAALYVDLATCLILQGSFDRARLATTFAVDFALSCGDGGVLSLARLNEAYLALVTGDGDARNALRYLCELRL